MNGAKKEFWGAFGVSMFCTLLLFTGLFTWVFKEKIFADQPVETLPASEPEDSIPIALGAGTALIAAAETDGSLAALALIGWDESTREIYAMNIAKNTMLNLDGRLGTADEYCSLGAESLAEAVSYTLMIDIEYYVKLPKDTLAHALGQLGEVRYMLDSDVTVTDKSGRTVFKIYAGEQVLDGTALIALWGAGHDEAGLAQAALDGLTDLDSVKALPLVFAAVANECEGNFFAADALTVSDELIGAVLYKDCVKKGVELPKNKNGKLYELYDESLKTAAEYFGLKPTK